MALLSNIYANRRRNPSAFERIYFTPIMPEDTQEAQASATVPLPEPEATEPDSPFEAQARFAQDISDVLGNHANSVPLVAMAKILFGVAVDLIVRQSAMQTNYTVSQYLAAKDDSAEEAKSKIIRL